MKIWKYTDNTKQVVMCGNESCSINAIEIQEWIARGNLPTPADPIYNPAIAEIDAKLIALDAKKIRPLSEVDAAYLGILNAQTIELRTARALLPKMI